MPKISVLIIGCMGLLSVIKAMRFRRLKNNKNNQEKAIDQSKRILAAIPFLIFCVLTVSFFGFAIIIPATLIFFMLLFGYRDWKKMVLITFIFILSVFLFFSKTVKIMLPIGTLLERLLY